MPGGSLGWFARVPEQPAFVAFSGWLDHRGRRGSRFDFNSGTSAIDLLALVDPVVTRARSLAFIKSCGGSANGDGEGRRAPTKEVNGVLVAATFALDLDGVWRKACHGWSDGRVFLVCDGLGWQG